MKIAKIRPIFKKGESSDSNINRPISILSVFSKILEKLIYNRLKLFINFRDNKSTETASQLLIVDILESMDQQLYVLGLFFDLTKVYDVINHEILLNKLEFYRIRGNIRAWIESYLSYPSQFVKIFKTDNRGRNQQIYKSSRKEKNTDSLRDQFWGPFCFYYLYK
jgi:hypothetical protein